MNKKIKTLRKAERRYTNLVSAIVDEDLFIRDENNMFDSNLRLIINKFTWHERKKLFVCFEKTYLYGANAVFEILEKKENEKNEKD